MKRFDKQEIYTRITNDIVGHLERGVRPWVTPWNTEHAAGRISRPLRHNGKPYSGINVLTLWASAMTQNFAAPIWMTFNQTVDLGGSIRKGMKGTLVVYADSISRKETDERTGDEIERESFFLKGYTVFNVEQIDGLPAVYYAKAAPQLDPVARIERVERFFAALGADIGHGGNQAFYSLTDDTIQMPPFASFRDAESYYATLAHECMHWTGSPSRLNRDFGGRRFASEGYGLEELVAELGAAFLCADLELSQDVRADHASYIASWLNILAQNKRALFTAAAHAQRAAEYIHHTVSEHTARVLEACAT
jgi:antirestriction protein ArdC